MIDHLAISTADYDKSLEFYTALLEPLGYVPLMVFDNSEGRITGFGRERPVFWVGDGGAIKGRFHLAFSADDRASVDASHRRALEAGGIDNGGPGIRSQYHPNYYAAFLIDPDGHNVEAVCHKPRESRT